jgi:uncharacterized protein
VDVSFVLTHDCNLGCTYCYAGEKFKRRMSDQVAESALELAFSGREQKIQLSFFGGEPLIEWERLTAITERARARAEAEGRELVLTLTTNGTLLDRKRVAWLNARAFFIALSVDGCKEAHEAGRPKRGGGSSFGEVVRGLELLVESEAWFETISVVSPANVRWLGESVRFLVERGVERVSLNPDFGGDWNDAALADWELGYRVAGEIYYGRSLAGRPVYINVIEDKLITHVKSGYAGGDHCGMGHGAVAVAPSGNLYPCERMVEEDRDVSMRIGHVMTGVDQGRLMCLDAQKGPVADECDGCGVKERCMSFCACANRAETGSIGVPGGVQCWHEQLSMRVADVVGARMWKARNKHFLARVYSYGEAA